jgi:hypothetical protein
MRLTENMYYKRWRNDNSFRISEHILEREINFCLPFQLNICLNFSKEEPGETSPQIRK